MVRYQIIILRSILIKILYLCFSKRCIDRRPDRDPWDQHNLCTSESSAMRQPSEGVSHVSHDDLRSGVRYFLVNISAFWRDKQQREELHLLLYRLVQYNHYGSDNTGHHICGCAPVPRDLLWDIPTACCFVI